jgi:hypothetical protein
MKKIYRGGANLREEIENHAAEVAQDYFTKKCNYSGSSPQTFLSEKSLHFPLDSL